MFCGFLIYNDWENMIIRGKSLEEWCNKGVGWGRFLSYRMVLYFECGGFYMNLCLC